MTSQGRIFTAHDFWRINVQFSEDTPVANECLAKFDVSYINKSGLPIVIKSRMGVDMFLKPKRQAGSAEVITVSLVWSMSVGAFRQSCEQLERMNPNPDRTTDYILKAFEDRYPRRAPDTHQQITAAMNIDIQVSEIIKNGGSAYIQDLDLMISVDEREQASVAHPYDRTCAVKRNLEEELPYVGKDTMVFGIKAVDNSPNRMYQDRFILMGDTVHHIPVERDERLGNGVHILRRPAATAQGSIDYTNNLVREQFTFEEADKRFGMADTIEKAQNGGDWTNYYKNQIAQRQHERTMAEMDRKEKLSSVEMEAMARKAHDAGNRYREDIAKEHAKGVSDWIKIAGGLITAFISLAGLFAKMKPA